MTALEEIKKALEEVTPERVERLWWFLHILAKSTGTTNAEDDKWNWINAFCTDYEDDTFNLAAKLGFITVRHDSFIETSTARITKAGMALVAHFDKAPSAALTSTLESLQAKNEGLLKRAATAEKKLRGANTAFERERKHHLKNQDLNRKIEARAEAAEAEVKRLQAEIDRKSSMPGDHRYWEGRYRDEAAENERLRKLLQPFATEAENWHDSVPDDHRTLCTEPNSTTAHPGSEANFTVGDLRRARTALASTGGEHHAE